MKNKSSLAISITGTMLLLAFWLASYIWFPPRYQAVACMVSFFFTMSAVIVSLSFSEAYAKLKVKQYRVLPKLVSTLEKYSEPKKIRWDSSSVYFADSQRLNSPLNFPAPLAKNEVYTSVFWLGISKSKSTFELATLARKASPQERLENFSRKFRVAS